MPKDTVEYRKYVTGSATIKIGLSKLLTLMLFPFNIDPNITINIWDWTWGMKKYLIDAAGELDCHILWKISEEETFGASIQRWLSGLKKT